MYGFFECAKCKCLWESAKVYMRGNTGMYWGQECKKCNIMCQPYRVEETTCSRCGGVARTCTCDKTRHTDVNKPHRSDLCEKCRSEKMYGFFQCPNCDSEWESGKVYYKNRATKEYKSQECRRCNIKCKPYRVEEIMCSWCHMKSLNCVCKSPSVDRDLCEKCQHTRP